jgi:mannosyltransferase OCH1-like enzyme
MIPKTIHYCWFGRGPKPADFLHYLAGWKKHLPDYRIIEWNEDNFDVQCCPYVAEAYEARKFAFVSDYARGHALFTQGGIYLDTDVEVLKSFNDLLDARSFWGFEAANFVATSTIGAQPGHEMIKAYLDQYHTRHFVRPDGFFDQTTNVEVVTRLWEQRGLARNDVRQVVGGGNMFYPQAYFSPYDYTVGTTASLNQAYAIHHYAKTWNGPWARIKGRVKKSLAKVVGAGGIARLRQFCGRKRGGTGC